jgi:hypothetical protein
MKKKLLIISIIILFLSANFCGCIEENEQKQNNNTKGLITTSIIDLLITIEDLPEGFIEKYSGEQYTSEFSRYPENKPIEYFAIGFTKGNTSNESGYEIITCELNRFSSIEDAEKAYSPTIEYIITEGNFEVIDGSINIIRNESNGITRDGFSEFLSFRILNVIGLVSSKDFSYTYDLAEIVEQRILDSIN